MHCARCGTDNQLDSNFCTQCGNPLVRSCAKCGAESPATSRFCGKCGAPLQPSVRIQTDASGGTAAGERRHLTVLFCDLVNSTRIASQLDPEEWREIVAGYHHAAAEAIERFGGHVAQYLGDGVMAYFGWPEAYDNNAERAAHAGLAILEALPQLNESSTRPKLSARVGIDSGPVVVGAGSGKNAEVFGDTPNIAARVQAAAPPGTVLVTADTHRLLLGLFVVEDYGKQTLKGLERQIQLYRVIQPSEVRGRLQVAVAAGVLTSFVGRDDELRLLMTRWERALAGEGQVVLISGEGGIGKSRLVHRVHQQIAGRPYNWVEGAASPFFQHTPFYPVAGILQELLEWESNAPGRTSEITPARPSRTRLSGTNGSNGHSGNRAVLENEEYGEQSAPPLQQLELTPRLAVAQATLNLSTTPKHPALPQQQRRLLSTLAKWMIDTAHVAPLIIAIEDLHWADASTLELIQLLAEQAGSAPLMLLCTARPEFRAQWPPQARVIEITLSPLGTHHSRMMVQEATAQEPLNEETAAAVVERGGGVPLFIEELTRAVLESGGAQLTGRKIPTTLHDSLMARLDRLGPAKEVIQIGAVIGNEFSYQLIRAVQPLSDESLQSALRSLLDAQLLYVSGAPPDATYRFKHALIRDAAYEALLKSRRKDLHRLVARTINERFPEIKEAHAELLARHWTEAGETEQAITEWARAGKAAEARNAFREALESYQRAAELLNRVPASPKRDNWELALNQSVTQMLQMTKGWIASETVEAVQHAAAIVEKRGNLKQLASSVVARGFTAFMAGELSLAGSLADQALDLALRDGRHAILAHGYLLQLMVRYSRGDFGGAEKHFTVGLKFFDDPRFKESPIGAPIAAFSYASWSAWVLGYADIARERVARMMAAVNEKNPHDEAFARIQGAILMVSMREYKQAEELVAGALVLSERNLFPSETAMSRWLLGAARAQLGNATEGIELIQRGLADLVEVRQRIGITHRIGWLAAAQAHAGALVDALATVEQALLANPEEMAYRPEMLRLRGELRMKQGQTELAEADFRDSIVLAQKMRAKAWELRATLSLARLLNQQRRRNEARTMLAEIYNWFMEGFDTADLKEAKALLAQLQAKQ